MKYSTGVEEVQIPVGMKEVEPHSLYERLQGVRDGRGKRGRRYGGAVVLTLLLLAKLAGETKLRGIAEWAWFRREALAKQLPLRQGKTPCANSYRYVCEQVDVGALNAVLGEYFAECNRSQEEEVVVVSPPVALPVEPTPQTHLALDGKSLRGTRRSGEAAQSAVHTLGLYNVTERYMWQQQPFPGKGQERQAAMTLIAPLNLQGTVVSADALHTHPKWAQAILDRGGEYLLMAKGNQSALREAVAFLFSQPIRPFLFPEGQAHTVNKGHGRLERRQLRTSCELNDYLAPRWPQVAQVFQLERTVIRQGKTAKEHVYGLTSLTPQQAPPLHLLALVRQHWRVPPGRENRNHWRRDVTLGEDACRTAVGQVPLVLAALNNAVLALIDFLDWPNLASAQRFFDAQPGTALDLLLGLPASHALLSFV